MPDKQKELETLRAQRDELLTFNSEQRELNSIQESMIIKLESQRDELVEALEAMITNPFVEGSEYDISLKAYMENLLTKIKESGI